MRQLYIRILIFIAPLLVLLILWPADERLRFLNMKDDCAGHAQWLHDRIACNTAPADIVFLGSSHSFNAIDDGFITGKIGNKQALNLGYCRLGTNLYLPIIRKLLAEKNPQKVVFEVREFEPSYSHPMFPYFAQQKDVITAWPILHPDYFSDLYIHFTYKTELIQQQIFRSAPATKISTYPYGHVPSAGVADSVDLHRKVNEKNMAMKTPERFKSLKLLFPAHYLREVTALCKAAGAEVYFLYLPGYASPMAEPGESEFYRQMGQLLIPPADIFQEPTYWFDEEHLNEKGSRILSEWLAEELK